jgi:DNA-binding SARP family transcriptional activator
MLACLLVRPGQLVTTESLMFELWGDNPPNTANNMVTIYVHRLRKEVLGDKEGKVLVYRAPGYLLRLSPGDLDFQAFESLAADGRAALAAGEPERAARLLGEALGMWRGPLFADVPLTPLLETEVDRAAELRVDTIELRAEADLKCGRAAQVVTELRALAAEHPLRERLWALLMRALEEAGRRAEALDTYSHAREVIADELGVDPGSELQRLYAELLAADASSASDTGGLAHTPAAPDRTGVAVPAQAGPPADDGEAAPRDDLTGGGGTAVPRAEPPGTIAIGTLAESAVAVAETGAHEDPGAAPDVSRPAQLPADIGDFTGRETHVVHLCSLLLGGETAGGPGAVRIAVVNGAGGLGKTTLAVHAAHQVRGEFPDGQLYVDLLGASEQPEEAGEVLARFLRDLGVAGDKVPARDDERAALYRTRLTGRRMLVLLDNARDAAQVRSLLPGSSSCAVLVTTRNRTPDLVSTRFVDLNVLEDAEALTLFSRIVGEDRVSAEPDATAEVLIACAGLPLAIRICAARLAARRQWRIATLAARLRSEQRRLDELSIGDLAVRASFQVSYDSLRAHARGVDPARVFRLLGLWQGLWIGQAAAAALTGIPEDDIIDALEALVDANLLESSAPGWYRFHDLLRVYATERAQAEEPETARAEAVGRLLKWYLDTAEAAANTVSPHRYQVGREPETDSAPVVGFDSVDEARAWYTDERTNIVAATRQAAAAGLHEVAWRLPPTLFPLFNRSNNWADCVVTHRVALDSARACGDRLGEAWALNQLGFALARLRDQEAFGHLEQALAIRQELGDTAGQAQTALGLGEAYLNIQGPGPDALKYMQLGADLMGPAGATSMRAAALNNLGEVYYRLGDLDAAEDCFTQALDIGKEFDRYAEGHALHNLGQVYLSQRRPAEAIASLTESVRKHRASRDQVGEATALMRLGQAQRETGQMVPGDSSLTAALALFEEIGDKGGAAEAAAIIAAGHV